MVLLGVWCGEEGRIKRCGIIRGVVWRGIKRCGIIRGVAWRGIKRCGIIRGVVWRGRQDKEVWYY